MNNSGIGYFIRVVLARAYVRVVGASRELSWLVGETLLPFLAVCGYVYVYRAMQAPPEYTGFVILGGILMTFWMNVLWSMAMQFFWEKEMGNLARYLMTPLPRPALLLGMAMGGMVMTTTRAIIIYGASRFVFHIQFDISNPWLVVAVFIATLGALYGLGMLLSSLFFIAGRGINYAIQSMMEPLLFIGGFYFPIRMFGMIAALAIAGLIPTALGLDALRQLMFSAFSTGLLTPETELIILSAMAVFFTWFAVWGIRKLEDLGREYGKLTVQEQ